MKTSRTEYIAIPVALFCLMASTTLAQLPSTDPTATPTKAFPVMGTVKDTSLTPSNPVSAVTSSSDSLPDVQLDKAVDALNKGDTAASAQALKAGIAGLEAEVQQKPTSFKDKLLSQVGKLKALLPLIAGGGLSGNVLQKAVGLTKLAAGGNRLEGLMSAGSLIGNAGKLTSSLSGLGGAMSVLGGRQSAGQSLISTAMAGVSKLSGGGALAKAAEPTVKNQLGSVLNFVKGAL